MAEENTIPISAQTLTVAEAQALADRLLSRSLSALFVALPEVRRDLCLASRAIRSMLHEVDRVAAYCEDGAHRLRAITIDVGGVLMLARTRTERELAVIFSRDGERPETRIVPNGERAAVS